MASRHLLLRLWVIALGPLACISAFGQATDAPTPASPPERETRLDTQSMGRFQLKGVLISSYEHTALVNGKVVREGDRVGGIEILAISQDGVRLSAGAREFRVGVGGTFDGRELENKDTRRLQRQATSSPIQAGRMAGSGPADSPPGRVQRRHEVQRGESLSGIALRYAREGANMNQTMIALFRENPHAFDDNINLMYQGASLRIPHQHERVRFSPATAAAEVARHREIWHSPRRQSRTFAATGIDAITDDAAGGRQYGPVDAGETLSAIAARELEAREPGVAATLDQMMIALFQANPQAFGETIHMLRQGAVLRMPKSDEIRRRPPDIAAAEVLRQTAAWQSGREQHANSRVAPVDLVASVNRQ